MKKNVGGFDRGIRFFASACLFIGGTIAPVSTEVKVVMYFFACTTLLTGSFSYCPVWPMLKINTFRAKLSKNNRTDD